MAANVGLETSPALSTRTSAHTLPPTGMTAAVVVYPPNGYGGVVPKALMVSALFCENVAPLLARLVDHVDESSVTPSNFSTPMLNPASAEWMAQNKTAS